MIFTFGTHYYNLNKYFIETLYKVHPRIYDFIFITKNKLKFFVENFYQINFIENTDKRNARFHYPYSNLYILFTKSITNCEIINI